jgi:glycosyltransferase involved in cell wall biosynthesis
MATWGWRLSIVCSSVVPDRAQATMKKGGGSWANQGDASMAGVPRPAPILFVVNTLRHGGTEKQLALTLEALDRDAFPPAVLALFRGGPNLEPIRDLGVPVGVLGAPRRGLLWAARAVEAAARRHGARIVHTALFESDVAGRHAARRTGALAVTHLVNEFESPVREGEPEHRSPWKARGIRALERWTLRRSGGRLIAVGDAVADSAARFFRIPRSSIAVVRRGFVFEELEARAEERAASSPWAEWAEPRIITVGRLNAQKGHRYLARALSGVVAAFPKAQVAVVGEGPLEAEVRGLARGLGVEEHLRLVGPRGDVPALLRMADLFVFPSLWEGAAGALVEAAALGVPLVATDIPPHREIVRGDLATLVPPREPRALEEGLIRTLRDPEGARDRAARLAPAVRAAHDIRANTRLLEDTYRRFLGEPA